MASIIESPIAYAHLQLRGGWKNIAITAGGYALLMIVLIPLSMRMDPLRPTAILRGWTMLLLGLQVVFLLILGCSSINTAVKLDLSSGMIESHRLMPVTPGVAIGGYLLGPTMGALAFAFVNFLIGSVTQASAQLPFAQWSIPNLILLVFSVFVWVLAVFTGFAFKNGFRWVFTFAVFATIARGSMLTLLPGLMVLSSPMIGPTIFNPRGPTMITWAHGVSILAQAGIGAVLFIAAARRYQRADQPAFGPLLGLLLLVGWVSVSAVGNYYWDDFSSAALEDMTPPWNARLISSLASAMLLACVPVAAACWRESQYNAHRAVHDVAPMRRPAPPEVITLLAALICLGICASATDAELNWKPMLLRSGVTVAAFLFSLMYMLRILGRRKARALVLVAAFGFVAWIVPVLIDFVRRGLSDFEQREILGPISSISPLGVLVQVWAGSSVNPTVGLVIQACVAAGLGVLFYSTMGRERDGVAKQG